MGVSPEGRFIIEWESLYCLEGCSTVLPVQAIDRHNITDARYRQMLHAQDGVCAICAKPAWRNGEIAPLVIDHDHVCCPTERRVCGRCTRGLLCPGCNGSLGELELKGPSAYRRESWTTAALAYLREVGCDFDLPHRRAWFAQELQRRRSSRTDSVVQHRRVGNAALPASSRRAEPRPSLKPGNSA
ncbi:endonuclease domain-containing protein [Krasilnikovia cinnamomea]